MKTILTLKYAQAQDLVNELVRPFDAAVDTFIGWLSKPRTEWAKMTNAHALKMDLRELEETIKMKPQEVRTFMNSSQVSPDVQSTISGRAAKAGINMP